MTVLIFQQKERNGNGTREKKEELRKKKKKTKRLKNKSINSKVKKVEKVPAVVRELNPSPSNFVNKRPIVAP